MSVTKCHISSFRLHFRAPSPTGSDDFAHCPMPFEELEFDEEATVASEAPSWTESSLLEETPPSWEMDNSFFGQPTSCFNVRDISECSPPHLPVPPEPTATDVPKPSTSTSSTPTPVAPPVPPQRLALKDRIHQLQSSSSTSGATHNGPQTPDGNYLFLKVFS
jgi:outer membrane biosynthesis protein TonB